MTTSERSARPNAKIEILNAAVAVAVRKGFRCFSRVDVAKEAEVAEATVSYHFGDMDSLRCEILKHAIEHKVEGVLNDLRSDRNRAELFRNLSNDERQKAAAYTR
jgi:DNA-binding transcriptional regulator YbjK